MSIGFRLFLLTLSGFGLLLLYRYRAEDIAFWLRAPRGVESTLAALETARVEDVLPPRVAIALSTPQIRVAGPRDAEEEIGPPEADGGPELADGGAAPGFADGGDPYAEEDYGPSEEPAEEDAGALASAVEDPGDPPAESFAQLADGGAVVDRLLPVAQGAEPAPEPTIVEYTVKPGDSLRKIAKRLLGKEDRYREIESLNRQVLSRSHFLQPNVKLRVPAR